MVDHCGYYGGWDVLIELSLKGGKSAVPIWAFSVPKVRLIFNTASDPVHVPKHGTRTWQVNLQAKGFWMECMDRSYYSIGWFPQILEPWIARLFGRLQVPPN